MCGRVPSGAPINCSCMGVPSRPPYTEQLLSLRRKQLLSQVSYDKSPENRIVSISRNMSHTCFRRLATARLCTIHRETFVARLVARQKLLRVWWPSGAPVKCSCVWGCRQGHLRVYGGAIRGIYVCMGVPSGAPTRVMRLVGGAFRGTCRVLACIGVPSGAPTRSRYRETQAVVPVECPCEWECH